MWVRTHILNSQRGPAHFGPYFGSLGEIDDDEGLFFFWHVQLYDVYFDKHGVIEYKNNIDKFNVRIFLLRII